MVVINSIIRIKMVGCLGVNKTMNGSISNMQPQLLRIFRIAIFLMIVIFHTGITQKP